MRDWITKDLGWKLFSAFLALVIWLTVHKIHEDPALPSAELAGVTLTYDNLPVQVVSATSDVRDYRVLPNAVTVKVSGSQDVIAILQVNQIHAVVDLTEVASAPYAKRHVEVSTPPGVTLVSVEPKEVAVLEPPKNNVKK